MPPSGPRCPGLCKALAVSFLQPPEDTNIQEQPFRVNPKIRVRPPTHPSMGPPEAGRRRVLSLVLKARAAVGAGSLPLGNVHRHCEHAWYVPWIPLLITISIILMSVSEVANSQARPFSCEACGNGEVARRAGSPTGLGAQPEKETPRPRPPPAPRHCRRQPRLCLRGQISNGSTGVSHPTSRGGMPPPFCSEGPGTPHTSNAQSPPPKPLHKPSLRSPHRDPVILNLSEGLASPPLSACIFLCIAYESVCSYHYSLESCRN